VELIVHVSFELFTALAQGVWLSKLGDVSVRVHTHTEMKHTPLTKLLAFFLSIYELTINFIEEVQKCGGPLVLPVSTDLVTVGAILVQ